MFGVERMRQLEPFGSGDLRELRGSGPMVRDHALRVVAHARILRLP